MLITGALRGHNLLAGEKIFVTQENILQRGVLDFFLEDYRDLHEGCVEKISPFFFVSSFFLPKKRMWGVDKFSAGKFKIGGLYRSLILHPGNTDRKFGGPILFRQSRSILSRLINMEGSS